MTADDQALRFLGDPVNFLYAADWRKDQCVFVPATREALAALPFLDNRTLGTSQKKGVLPFGRVARTIASPAFGHRAGACDFLFHSAFCCSTLIARCLDVPGGTLALKEPFAILNLSGLLRNSQDADGQAWRDWSGVVLKLLSRPFTPGEKTLVKPSNGANNILPHILGEPGCAKAVLLYSDLESFLVSVLSGGDERTQFISGILAMFRADFGTDLKDLDTPAPLKEAALAWGLQVRLFEQAAKAAGADKVRTLDCQRFLDDPAGTLAKLSAFYGYGLTASQTKAIATGPLMGRHAKEGKVFSARERAAEKDTITKAHGKEIDSALAWAKDRGFDFAKGLANPL